MTKEKHGCACCSGGLNGLITGNKAFQSMRDEAEAGKGWSCNWGIDFSRLGRRDFIKTSVAAASLATLLPGCSRSLEEGAHKELETTIFTGGTVLTVDDDFSEVEAIAIRGKRILSVGTNSAVRKAAGNNAKIVDLKGKTLLPGFVEAHTHVISGSIVDAVMEYVGMARFQTTDQVLAQIQARVAETPAGEWLVFRNFDPAVQEGLDALTFAELDPISLDHPIFVLNASGHLAYANSRAFEAAGISPDVENPPGGEFVRDADGKLTGLMKNNVAFIQVASKYPAMMEADPVEGLIKLVDKWSALGLTTVSELSLGALAQSPADGQVMAAAAQTGRLNARIRAYPFYTLGTQTWDEANVRQGDGNAMARIAGYKLVADGSNQGFTGLQREPYLGTKDDRGLAYMSSEELTAAALERAKKGWHLAIHGNGDAAIDNILDTCQALRDAGIDMSKVRPRIEHCSILHDEQIARMKELGVSASFLIGHVHYWGIAMRDEIFGEEKVQLLDRCRSVEEAGVGFSLHSDFMVTDPDPLHMIEMAVTRKTWKEPNYVLAPKERISVESAIRALTSEAAWQLFSEHEVGSLEPGKFADLVILDKDPRRVNPDTIKEIKVIETWMDGEQIYQA
jgi:predicted amidohydrolase YtcJ